MAEVDGRFPAGKYYFGDICYVLADNHYYQVWGDKYNFDPGIIPIGGSQFAVDSTAYGDGVYYGMDNKSVQHELSVDAGVLGLVPWDLVADENKEKAEELGFVFVSDKELVFRSEGGEFSIHTPTDTLLYVDTNDEEEEYEEEDDYEDEYEDDYEEDDEPFFESTRKVKESFPPNVSVSSIRSNLLDEYDYDHEDRFEDEMELDAIEHGIDSLKDHPQDHEYMFESTSRDYRELGKAVKSMLVPGSSRIGDELFALVDSLGGVQEAELVKFFRSKNLTSISQEDIIEIEDLIEQAWQEGRKARNMRPTGINAQRTGWRESKMKEYGPLSSPQKDGRIDYPDSLLKICDGSEWLCSLAVDLAEDYMGWDDLEYEEALQDGDIERLERAVEEIESTGFTSGRPPINSEKPW